MTTLPAIDFFAPISALPAFDKVAGKSESLKTNDKSAAQQLLVAMNQSVAQPRLNRSLAKACLSAKSPELLTRA